MSLLELEDVCKSSIPRAPGIRDERLVLRNVSLQLEAGEVVGIWGLRGSGRSTLLRLAAGIERPDRGFVRLAGRDLTKVRDPLGDEIGFCHPPSRPSPPRHRNDEGRVVEDLIAAALAHGLTSSLAKARSWRALERAGVDAIAEQRPCELKRAEAVCVAIARAVAAQPSLLLVDEPIEGVDLFERDRILDLLDALAKDGIAVLACFGESTALFGVDRALTLSGGELHGHMGPELAPIVKLPLHMGA